MKIDTSIRSYKDSSGKEYVFDFTVGQLRKLKREHGVDLLDNSDGCHYTLQMSDDRLLWLVSIVLGIPEDAQLFDELDARRLLELRNAFWGGLGFFFQTSNPTKWTVLEKELGKSTETIQKIQEFAIRQAMSQSGSSSTRLLDT